MTQIKLRYQKGDIRFQFPHKRLNSSEVSTWDDLKTHISSLSSKVNPLTFIHIFEGEKIIVTDSDITEIEDIEWSKLNITLWNAVKAEISAL